ncbi:MAG: PIN domain-containing protein [Ignavibacteriaceae bacterium]
MQKLYIDLCVYNRPFDFQGHDRIALESNAFIYLLQKIEKGDYSLLVSDALYFENNKNPNEQKKRYVFSYFKLAKENIKIEVVDISRAKELVKLGFTEMDALHIAVSEKSKADYFITCDDRIVRLYKKHILLIRIKIMNILEFIALEAI